MAKSTNRYVKRSSVVTAEALTADRIAKEFPSGTIAVAVPQHAVVDAKPGDVLISHPPLIVTNHMDGKDVQSEVPQYEVLSPDDFAAGYEPADE